MHRQRLSRLIVVAVLLGAVASIGDVSAQQAPQQFEGTLLVVWGDPDPAIGGAGETRFSLVLPDGTVATLQLTGPEGDATSYSGRRVIVSGQLGPAQPAVADAAQPTTIAVNSIALSPNAVESAAVTGVGRVIYLLVRFSDDVDVPHPPDFFLDLTNPDTPPAGSPFVTTLNGFFKKTSWNQFSWVADVGGLGGLGAPGGWLTLPNPRSHYAPCVGSVQCANINAISNDATAMGRAQGINFRNYDNINFVLSNDIGCCAYGGTYFDAADFRTYRATWEPPWGQETPTYAHEMGHSIGLPHSGFVYSSYDSPWDVMSLVSRINPITCGSYRSANLSGAVRTLVCPEPGDGYIAAHKEFLGWIPPANAVVTDTLATVTATVEGAALPPSASIRMIKVCVPQTSCTNLTGRYLTVEARVRGLGPASQFDNGIPGEGVLIHEVRSGRPPLSGPCFPFTGQGVAKPIDVTPGDYDSINCTPGNRVFPNYALNNAQLTPGGSYFSSEFGVTISVASRTGSSFLVSVTSTPPPVITSEPASQTISSGQAATVSVMAASASPLSYQWYIGASGVTTVPVGGATSSSHTTPPRTSSAQYWVRVSNPFGSTNSAAATVRVAFSDDALSAGGSIIRLAHLTELRSRVDGLRARFGLAAYAWTDPAPAPGVTPIKAAHLLDLRIALEQAYSASGRTAPAYTDPMLPAAMVLIRATHIQELRAAVDSLEQS